MSTEENKAIVRRCMDALWTRGDLSVLEELVTADYIEHSGPPGLPEGRDNMRAQVQIFRTAAPDLRHETHDLIAEGDLVVERWTATGTHLGDFFGIPPTGRPIQTSGVHIFRLANGQIAEHWGNSDDLGVLRQVGVIP